MKRRAWVKAVVMIISLLMAVNPAFAKQDARGAAVNSKAAAVAKGGYALGKSQQKGFRFRNQEKKAAMQKSAERTAGKRFQDLEGHWAKGCVEKLQALGWISGYPDMTFRPDAPVTELEAVAMIVSMAEDVEGASGEAQEQEAEAAVSTEGSTSEASEASAEGGEASLPADVPAWGKGIVEKAASLKIVNINRFHSHVQALRAGVAVMLAKALGLQPVDTSSVVFKDQLLISKEDLGYILALVEAGIIKGTPDGRFNPNSAITRAEMAAMLAQVAAKAMDGDSSAEDLEQDLEQREQSPEGVTQEQQPAPEQSAQNTQETVAESAL